MPIADILSFLICAAVIFICGKRLSYYGKLIAEKTGIGNAWVGLVLVASITSLPELIVGISSAAIVQSPDLAVGDVIGSCAFNLLLLSFLDLLSRKPILCQGSATHVLAAAMCIILLCIAGTGLFLPEDYSIANWLGIVSLIAFCGYFLAIRIIFNFEKRNRNVENTTDTPDKLSKIILYYILNGLAIVAAAVVLPNFARNIAAASGLGLTFVGTAFVAAATSLPEVAVSKSALAAGNIDIAIGNILGSNIFNIFILSVDDAFYLKGNLLHHASGENVIPVFAAIIMSAITIAGLTIKLPAKRFLLAWDTFAILITFITSLSLLYWISF